ncbi:MAG: hypothetical protein SWO11_14940 [Thermodesulfobacteriota bacterium]|nr:hypothetical protein [Thermodesulfobacteriota bacterium]
MAQQFLVKGRICIAARCLGIAEHILEMAIAYAKKNRPLASIFPKDRPYSGCLQIPIWNSMLHDS